MAVKFAVIRSTTPASATTKSFTSSGFGTPEAVIAYSEDSTEGLNCSYGFTDGTTDWCATWNCEDAQSKSDTVGGLESAIVFHRQPGLTNKSDIIGVFSQWVTDGIEIDFTTANLVADITLVLIGDTTDVTAYVGAIDLGSDTSDVDVTAPGFQPDLVLTLGHISNTSIPSTVIDCKSCLGAADGTDSRCTALYEPNGLSTTDVRTHVSHMYSGINYTAPSQVSLKDFDSSGFTVDKNGGNGSSKNIPYMALAFSGVSVKVGGYVSAASTGSDEFSGVGFKPQFIQIFGSPSSGYGAWQTASPWCEGSSIYSADGTTEGGMYGASDDNVGTTNTRSGSVAGFRNEHGGSTRCAATLTSFDSDGWTMNYSVAQATTVNTYWAVEEIGGDTTGVGESDGTSTATAVGTGIKPAVGESDGAGAATAVGTGIFPSAGASDGTSTVAATGVSTAESDGTSTGVSTATATGVSTAESDGTSTGISTATATGVSTAESAGASTGISTVAAIGTGILSSVGASDGVSTATATGVSTAESDGTSTGTSTATATGKSYFLAVGVSTGTSTATATSVADKKAVGVSDGVSTAILQLEFQP
ncbi:MAG: hypothetical protein ACXABY_00410 [Candidatus Thorarchaeota archaeon]